MGSGDLFGSFLVAGHVAARARLGAGPAKGGLGNGLGDGFAHAGEVGVVGVGEGSFPSFEMLARGRHTRGGRAGRGRGPVGLQPVRVADDGGLRLAFLSLGLVL